MSRAGTAAYEPGEPRAGVPLDPDEFREALGLVQEGMLKVVRFQLAMERRDRRGAMAAIDDVVHLERRIADLVVRNDDDVRDRHLQAERAALAQEKFTLAAGISAGAARTAAPVREEFEPCAPGIILDPGAQDASVTSWVPPAEVSDRGITWARLACALAATLLVTAGLAAATLESGSLGRLLPALSMTGGES